MLPDRVSNPGPLTYESGALLIALLGPARAYLYFRLPIYHNKRPGRSILQGRGGGGGYYGPKV